MKNFLIAKATDVGVARQVNEDSMTVFESPNGQVLAVCDGMGGQAAGDVASQLAVSIIENILTDNTFTSPDDAIRRSILAANQGVLNRTASSPELAGMGSTCVMLIVKDGQVHCGWVGDSRAYYVANHRMRQISHDQSYVQMLVDGGLITKEDAANHPQRNEITNCIGLEGMTEPETIASPIVPESGSIFMLCSDGLSCMVAEDEMERLLLDKSLSLQEKADKLITLANEAGGLDNITVILMQTAKREGADSSKTIFDVQPTVTVGHKQTNNTLYSVIAIILIAAICLGSYWIIKQNATNSEKTRIPETKGKITTVATPEPPPTATMEPAAIRKQETKTEEPPKNKTRVTRRAVPQKGRLTQEEIDALKY